MKAKYVHVNLVSKSFKELAAFYINVFGCVEKPPVRNLKGKWVDNLTSIKNSHIQGVHLLLPGYDQDGPTLEIFQYAKNVENNNKAINKEGFGHIAFAVSDVNQCVERIIEHKGSLVGEIVSSTVENIGVITVAYCRDPEDNIIEIQKWEYFS